MSEFLATAQVLVRPNTAGFRADLEAQLLAATRGITLPVSVVAAGSGVGAVTAATAQLAAAQTAASGAALDLQTSEQILNSVYGKQAVILETVSAETAQLAGAQIAGTKAARAHAVGQSQVGKAALASTAGMLGLRGAVLTAGSAFIAATVGFQAFGKAVGSTIDFTRELAVFRVTAGASADEMKRVSDTARELGRDITLPGVAAGDAAQALTELSKAGLSVQQALDAAQGTLQLATAAEIDNAAAATLVANSLNSFQLSGAEAARVADLLAGAANASQGSIEDMGLALKQSAAAAHLVGLDVNETVTLLTELARAGLSASDAGTSLRTLLLRLVGDFPKVQQEVERLGLNLRDLNGNIRPEFFAELGDRLASMAPKTRQFTLALLGGSDAIRSISILSRASTAEFDSLLQSISRTGIAADVAAAQTEGLGGDVEAAKNQFADLGLTVGNVASGPLSLLVRTAGQAAGAINDVNSAVSESAGGQGFFESFGNAVNDFANSFSRLNVAFAQGVRNAQAVSDRFTGLDAITKTVTDSVNGLADALERAGKNTLKDQGIPESGLNVQQVLNRVTGFDTQETGARIRQDSEALLGVLESEREFLIEQLDRRFVKNRPALFRKLQDALLGVTNDIGQIGRQSATETKKAAKDLATTTADADNALLTALSNRREDAGRRAGAATETAGVQDDIQAQNRIQALIKVQIVKIRARIKDEQARASAVRELRIALINSRTEEKNLREQQRQAAADAKTQLLDINIQIAETRGQEALEKRLLALKIKRLKAQIKSAKGDRLLQAQLKLELAQTQKQLEDLNKQQEQVQKAGKTFAQQSFEFLQTQQGFAANLLGNLIPGFATGGLVGGSGGGAPAEGLKGAGQFPGTQAKSESALSSARERGVRPVQVDTTNHLLRQILSAVQGKHTQSPEIAFNRGSGGAVFDIF